MDPDEHRFWGPDAVLVSLCFESLPSERIPATDKGGFEQFLSGLICVHLFAAHNAGSPAGGSPAMVNDNEPSSDNRPGTPG